MFLKRLDIVGFKSFADHIRVDCEPGIIGVVGPNGCGKSNIIDAIRWCLGEMSAKSLRSSAMLDVVFNGSGSRPPQNMAEVTLTFDNSDKRLPIDFEEVSITRRLFRSGESEYFMNKTQCRLRDIRELFLDTGMGEDGYYAMEQGKVEWILQAKPEDRRELFEEAAGVSKYRARREEALRKMERVEIDLSRISDIIAVTQDQIRKLENAVSKAKTYQRIREELKVMEISDWLFQLTNSDVEMKEIQERLAASQRSAEELNTQVHQVNADVAEHRRALVQLEEELLQANSVLAAIDADVKIGEERQANAARREQELGRQVEAIRDNIQREQTRSAELAGQLQAQIQALEELKADGAKIESDFAEAQGSHNQTLEQLETKKREVKETRDMILDRAQERSRLQQQISHLSSDVTRFESQAQSGAKEKERVQSQLDEALRSIGAAELQNTELTRLLGEKSTAREALIAALANLSAKEDELRTSMLAISEEIAQLKGQIQSIREQQDQDPYLAGAHAVLSAGLPGISGPVGKIIQCADVDRDLVAATIGEHLADLVADTAEDARRAIDFLSAAERGRARIWVLEKLDATPDAGALAEIPGRTRLAQRISSPDKYKTLIRALIGSYVIEGTLIYGPALLNGGIDPAKWKSHVTHRLPELESALEIKEKTKLHIEEEIRTLEREHADTTLRKDAAIKEMEEVRIRLELLKEELAKLSKRRDSLQEEQQVIEMELAQVQDEKVKAKYQLEEGLGRFQTLQAREKDDHDQLDLLQQSLTDLQHVHAKANAELAAKEERHKDFQNKLAWHESVIGHSRKEIEAVAANQDRHQKESARMAADIEAARTAQAEARALIEDSMAKREKAAAECAAIQTRRAELTATIADADLKLTELRAQLSTAQESAQTELLRETTVRGRLEMTTQKLHDQYEMSVDDARQSFQPQAAEPESLERLKKRVANIGPINLAAPQEHQELSEKNTFLTTQQADLLKAKEDLRQVITKINATTREHFRETFEKIRTNFRALYSQLFQGGEADLRFTDEADILNTGIDIFCQPPGKKLLHISLLSGGEKALTAIALLFAFFQVRPSPVTLLDEVDAPLDEANVLRYAEMIKFFSEKSQFILITHNKRTMERANVLYGVTMEELGVSKVISARLSKKEKAETTPESTATAGA